MNSHVRRNAIAIFPAIMFMFSASTLKAGGIPVISWDGGGDGTSASDNDNWNPAKQPSGDDNVQLPGGLGGPQTIDIGGSVLQVRLLEATNSASANPYTLTNGTIEIFLTGGNSILTRDTGGAVTVDADIVFPAVATGPRFNVEPSAPPIVVNGNITTSVSSGAGTGSGVVSTTVLELTSSQSISAVECRHQRRDLGHVQPPARVDGRLCARRGES